MQVKSRENECPRGLATEITMSNEKFTMKKKTVPGIVNRGLRAIERPIITPLRRARWRIYVYVM